MTMLYPVRSRHIAARMLGGETMIMSSRDATLFNLDDVGSAIWEAADGRNSLEDIVANQVCAQFDVSPEVALPDAESFVRELAAHGIMELADKPVEEGSSLSASVSGQEKGTHSDSQEPRADSQQPGGKS
jgi:Coenzyme PQQ synthesis protein D (PqqD)